MEFIIENNKDKECEALSDLFTEITLDMKSAIPNFEELSSRAGKLHSSLKQTVSALSTFLDVFQRIAEDASNNSGATSDIGSCMMRALVKQRSLESRMKNMSGQLMEDLLHPLQEKSEEWKKSLNTLEKEHIKGNKKSRRQIKKKSEAVIRLKKKLRKEKYTDPSLKRGLDDTLRELNMGFSAYAGIERLFVQRALSENRRAHQGLLGLLRPVLIEEMALSGELVGIDGILRDCDAGMAPPIGSMEPLLEALLKNSLKNINGDDHYILHLPTPPSSPKPSLPWQQEYFRGGPYGITRRQWNEPPYAENKLNGHIYSVANCNPRIRRPNSSVSLHNVQQRPEYINRPWSTAFWNFNHEYRRQLSQNDHSSPWGHPPSSSLNSEAQGSEGEESSSVSEANYSTIKRTCNPLYRSPECGPFVKNVSIPRRCSSADRSLPPINLNRQFINCLSNDNKTDSTSSKYATPKPLEDLDNLPNFNSNKGDMVIPKPIYLNGKTAMKNVSAASSEASLMKAPGSKVYAQPFGQQNESQLKNQRVARGQSTPPSNEEGSSNSSDSICSSSGYGSQFTINTQQKLEDSFHFNPLFITKRKPLPPIRCSSMPGEGDHNLHHDDEIQTTEGQQIQGTQI
eukprot:TRINITY_DN7162_c0_g1_i1.p1 TRINITY_DN7162_c0_g1~~TRINITY_DN7162_c0_g1_i1.p1  ORF type:complete len:626 (-),score=127.15 TRINITY_DN7162_c0_g1_i1:180-2057(-)